MVGRGGGRGGATYGAVGSGHTVCVSVQTEISKLKHTVVPRVNLIFFYKLLNCNCLLNNIFSCFMNLWLKFSSLNSLTFKHY